MLSGVGRAAEYVDVPTLSPAPAGCVTTIVRDTEVAVCRDFTRLVAWSREVSLNLWPGGLGADGNCQSRATLTSLGSILPVFTMTELRVAKREQHCGRTHLERPICQT